MTGPDKEKRTRQQREPGRIARLRERVTAALVSAWNYWDDGIWADNRQKWWVNLLKTLNICTKSFTDTDLQTQACAMTYRTVLAIVPALALLLAIGRGFGFNDFISQELYGIFPGQGQAISEALKFVDGYLSTASEGVFVGIGILFLIYTLYSLIDNVENAFNKMWGVSQGRSIWRKITDYTAMMFILPVIMICAGGLSLFVTSTIQNTFDFEFMTPVKGLFIDLASWVLTWVFFAAAYKLIPNTKVKFANALVSGIIAGSAFRVLQWLFVSGQVYVTRYNAIYGSFAFLPLLLLWIQLTWVITLTGALICYSSQNIFLYALSTKVSRISPGYRRKVIIAVMAMIVRRFQDGKPAMTAQEMAADGELPPRLVSDVLFKLINAGLVVRTVPDTAGNDVGYQPASDPTKLTIGTVLRRLANLGDSDFITAFSHRYSALADEVDLSEENGYHYADTVLISSLPVKRHKECHASEDRSSEPAR